MKNNSILIKPAVLIVSFLFCTALQAQVNGQLKQLQKKFNSLKNISAEFTESANGTINLAGRFYYEKENKLRIDLKDATIVSDGTNTWNYNKKEKKLIIGTYDKNDPSLLSIKNIVDVYPSECKVETGIEGKTNILTLTPKTGGLPFNSVKIKLNGESLISSMVVIDRNGREMQFDFTNYKTNENLPKSLFTISPPKGSKVIDLR